MKSDILSSGFPRHNIEVSLKRGIVLYNAIKDKEVERKDLFKALNLSIKSGHAGRAIVSLKCYGIIESVNLSTKFKINKDIKNYFISGDLTEDDFTKMLMNIPLYKKLLSKFSIKELTNKENKNKITEYLLSLKIESPIPNQNIIDLFFQVNDDNSIFYNNFPFNDEESYNKIKQENIQIPDLKNQEYNVLPFPIDQERIIEIKYPKDIKSDEIEIVNIALECFKKIINKPKE